MRKELTWHDELLIEDVYKYLNDSEHKYFSLTEVKIALVHTRVYNVAQVRRAGDLLRSLFPERGSDIGKGEKDVE